MEQEGELKCIRLGSMNARKAIVQKSCPQKSALTGVNEVSNMLGWNISVYRQMNNRTAPAKATFPKGTRLAVWQTGLGGLDWILELVKEGKAIDLGSNGYPSNFTATVEHLIPPILNGPPEANSIWACGAFDILGEKWEGKTVINQTAVVSCLLGEWLLVEAWDES